MMRKRLKQSGFTVLELMIASSIFSVVLLVIAAGILRFSQDYYKGINATNTQATARAVMGDIAQSIQFGRLDPTQYPSDPIPSGAVTSYCIDSTLYTFQIGVKVDSGKSGLVKTTGTPCSGATPTSVPTPVQIAAGSNTMSDLLGGEMRLAQLSIKSNGSGAWNINLKVVYGDTADMFTDASGNTPTNDTGWNQAQCKNQSGQQYCAISQLSTTVQRRL